MSEHDEPVAVNLLARRFEAPGPNQGGGGDTTEFVISGSGKLSVATVLHLFSSLALGWAVSAVDDRHLAMRALTLGGETRVSERVSCNTPIEDSAHLNRPTRSDHAHRVRFQSSRREGHTKWATHTPSN